MLQPDRPIVVHEKDAEVIEGTGMMRLLADAHASGGAMSISTGVIPAGADGAKPHFHALSWEVFYLLDGTLEILLGEDVTTVERGGLVAVPPRLPHAFGAAPGASAEALVFITPGVDRFDYFRVLPRVLRGELPAGSLAEMHERYDVHFVESPAWEEARKG
ncbi:cupin domain-containing protein [Spirillospora sp. NPDC047279]|uniref:cupin domain-containing protein n=1 Tax=Spirillospora sp. NPDC047279 TaxID=3155478 RepID=UPI0033F67946